MNWTLLADHLAAAHGSDYQSIHRVRTAVQQAQEAITTLGVLGHHYHLEEGPPPPQQEWPRYMFHERCPEGLLVHGPEQQAELGDGWRQSLAEARQAHGLKVQFAGRGGVKLTDLPAVILGQDPEGQQLSRDERIAKARSALEEFWATSAVAEATIPSGEKDAIEITKATSANGSGSAQSELRQKGRGAAVSRL